MVITIVVLSLIACALLLALRDTMAKLEKSESRCRLLERQATILRERDHTWETYCESLESTLATVQSFHRATQNAMLDKYQKVVELAKKTAEPKSNGNNGNGHKETPQNAPQAVTATTLADLGTISPEEQNKIDTWRKNGKAESDMIKWITDQRNSAAKKAAKQTVKA